MTHLDKEHARLRDTLESLSEAIVLARDAQQAAERQAQQQNEKLQQRQEFLDAYRSSAAEQESRKNQELQAQRHEIAKLAHALAAAEQQISELQQQLQEACERLQDEQEVRLKAEDYYGLARREAASRRKLEAEVKRAVDAVDGEATLRSIRAKIEGNDQVRRLKAELTAARNQELWVRQRATQELNRVHEEIALLRAQLSQANEAA